MQGSTCRSLHVAHPAPELPPPALPTLLPAMLPLLPLWVPPTRGSGGRGRRAVAATRGAGGQYRGQPPAPRRSGPPPPARSWGADPGCAGVPSAGTCPPSPHRPVTNSSLCSKERLRALAPRLAPVSGLSDQGAVGRPRAAKCVQAGGRDGDEARSPAVVTRSTLSSITEAQHPVGHFDVTSSQPG